MREPLADGSLQVGSRYSVMCPAPTCHGAIVLMGGWWSKLWVPFLSKRLLWIWWWRGGVSFHFVLLSGLRLAKGVCNWLASTLSGIVAGWWSKLLGPLRPLLQDPFLLSKGGGDSFLAQIPLSHTTHLLPGWRGGGRGSWPHYLLVFFLSLWLRWSVQSVIICGITLFLPALCLRQFYYCGFLSHAKKFCKSSKFSNELGQFWTSVSENDICCSWSRQVFVLKSGFCA